MASRDQLDQWETWLNEIGELYAHIIDTVADLPEPKIDLAGSTSKGKPAPLPGGIKMPLVGPHSLYAPPDTLAHPGVFLERWCGHVGRKSRSIPPSRTRHLALWEARLAWLRERLQWVDDEQAFHDELRAVRGLLRNVCHWDRKSLGELADERDRAADNAQRTIQARMNDIPAWYLLTREQAGIIWPVFRSPADNDAISGAEGGIGAVARSQEAMDDVDGHREALNAWKAVRESVHRYRNSGDAIGRGKAPFVVARKVAESSSVTKR